MSKVILVTGGAGFIGSHFVRMALLEADYSVINLDALTYAGRPENNADIKDNIHYRFVRGSITDRDLVHELMQQADFVVNFAAESHVDRSIVNPGIFVETNVLGTQTLLDAAREHSIRKFVQVSTDEVYGALALDDQTIFTEETPLAPNSPYSASKAGADLLCRAAYRTHGVPVCISRCSNNYGTHQLAEKLIPYAVTRALKNQPIGIYGDGKYVRDWVHVTDHCRAVLTILERAEPGSVYNVGSDNEWANIDVMKLLLRTLGKPESLIEFTRDRPGHDRRYAIDSSKIQRELGWKAERTDFEKELALVIDWCKKTYA